MKYRIIFIYVSITKTIYHMATYPLPLPFPPLLPFPLLLPRPLPLDG